MTFRELEDQIATIPWFSKIGEPLADSETLMLRFLSDPPSRDWDSSAMALYQHEPFREVSLDWDWLPTSRDDRDPVHGDSLLQRAKELGCDTERRTAEMAASQVVLNGLRSLPRPHPKLRIGRNNLTESARGGAMFAVRMAVRELITDSNGFWCSVIPVYVSGRWPCGITTGGKLVVL